jgi:Fe-S cluster biogenesis protein NfuA
VTSVRDTGARIEELLARLRSGSAPSVAATAEELVRVLVGMYGDGLARVVSILAESGPAGMAALRQLAEDPLVEGLLLVHDLHPLDVDARIQRALDRVRPYLGSHAGGVEYLGVTDGVARLRLEGSCHGCPSSTVTVRLAIEDAVRDAAPEVTEVAVEGMTEAPGPNLLQIGPRPPASSAAGPGASPGPGAAVGPGAAADADAAAGPGAAVGTAWVTLPDVGPPSARPVLAEAGGRAVLVCAVRGTLYAYVDACACCGGSLAEAALDREQLTCPACQARYDVRLAGRGLDDPSLRLEPLPLIADSQGVRVAMPQAAVG